MLNGKDNKHEFQESQRVTSVTLSHPTTPQETPEKHKGDSKI